MRKILVIVLALSCGDNKPAVPIDTPEGELDDGFRQVEMVARPGINEALLVTQDLLNAYNATAPTFAGVPSPTLAAIEDEAKTVLKAFYLGACLLNGIIPGSTAETGLHPAGLQCHAIGGALFTNGNPLTGTTLTDATKSAAQLYADKVFAQLIPDVLRIDTSVDSFYQTLCGNTDAAPLLCGGRFLNDDTIDITYDYLLHGAATPTAPPVYDQRSALTSDGVNFSTTPEQNRGTRIPTSETANNPQQNHPIVSDGFPYSAAPQ